MTLKNCRDCGKLVTYGNDSLCIECLATRDEEMARIRDCIRFNNNLSVSGLSRETGISISRLLQFIHEGLVEIKL